MTSDTHLDGNALGGLLWDIFGREMTQQQGCCDNCGTVSAFGSLIVYRGPGDVLRCPACGDVIIVVVSTPVRQQVNFVSLRWLNMEGFEADPPIGD